MADAAPDFESIDYRRSQDPRKYFAERRSKVGTFDTEEGYEGRIMVLTYDEGMRATARSRSNTPTSRNAPPRILP